MEARPLLLLGVAAAIGAAAVQPACPGRFLLLTAFVAWLTWRTARDEPGRIRALAGLALVAGAASAWAQTAHQPVPLRARTMRVACTVLDARTCAADSGLNIAIDAQANLPP